eukprot:6209132-Pleurochrysis_carterae.AAC.1
MQAAGAARAPAHAGAEGKGAREARPHGAGPARQLDAAPARAVGAVVAEQLTTLAALAREAQQVAAGEA